MKEPRFGAHAMPCGGVVYTGTLAERVVRVVVPKGFKNKSAASLEDQARDYVDLPPTARMY